MSDIDYTEGSLLEWKATDNGFVARIWKNNRIYLGILSRKGNSWKLDLIKNSDKSSVLKMTFVCKDEEQVKAKSEYYIYDGI
jgi:hypothetical protein